MLQALLLDSNQIEMISDRAFAGLTQLKRLSLNENRIQMLNGGLLDAVPAITFLDLRSNELQTLTYENVRPILHNLYNETSFFLLESEFQFFTTLSQMISAYIYNYLLVTFLVSNSQVLAAQLIRINLFVS